jgi:tetraacyldisaccharide 4'-kinase
MFFIQKLKPQKHQEIYFTKIKYVENHNFQFSNINSQILLVTGIANPTPLVHYLETQYQCVHKLHFSDHHLFTRKDIQKIIRLKEKSGGENCIIITTEKDSARLQAFDNMPEYYVIPVEIVFLEKEAEFKKKLLSLLKQNDA